MTPQITEYFYNLFMRIIKLPSMLIVVVSITVATVWYVTNPTGKPYIKTAGSNLEFYAPLFNECVIIFSNPVIVNYASIELSEKENNAPTNQNSSISQLIPSIPLNKELDQIIVKNDFYKNQPLGNIDNHYLVKIVSTRSLHFAIEKIAIDGKVIDIKNFFEKNLKSKSEYIGLRYIRKDLSDFIFSKNDLISNFILTFMYFSICVLILKLLEMEVKAYLYKNECFKEYLIHLLDLKSLNNNEENNNAWDEYTAHWAKWDTFFRYLQALGPATGFILTVSSLIESLHPIVETSSNIDEFLKGIHVAMISTFLGLLLRIVALEASRVNDVLLNRSDFVINQTMIDQQVNHQASSEEAPGNENPSV